MSRIMRRLGIAAGILIGLLVLLAAAGYLYLRNSDWWIAVTLFSDEQRAENFRTMHDIFPSRTIAAGDAVWRFARDEQPLPAHYRFEGEQRALAEFLEDSETTGLLVARDGVILHESYYRGYDERSLATSFSMAKSFASALVGIAIEQGYIGSVRDPISDYAPELIGSGYEGVSIHDVLTMSSGVSFDEDYDSFFSDVMWLPIRIFGFRESVPEVLVELERGREPGTYNEYISSDSLALSLLLSNATGRSVSQYLEETLWIPAGMEHPAAWNIDYHGNELTHAFLSVTLRDYARFGRLYLNEGRRDGRPIIPADWVRASLDHPEPHLQPGDNPASFWTFGYGYQWWIPEQPEGDFVAIGVWGQFIYVHPVYDIVIAKTSTDYHFDTREHETIAVFRSIARAMAGEG